MIKIISKLNNKSKNNCLNNIKNKQIRVRLIIITFNKIKSIQIEGYIINRIYIKVKSLN